MFSLNNTRKTLKATIVALSVFFIFKASLEVFLIPTNSMNCAIYPGNKILVNKLAYGWRIPITPLSSPFAYQKHFSNSIEFPYKRIGYASPNREDILVFNDPNKQPFPIDHKTHLVKRLVGLPGDTIEIKNDQVFINNTPRKYKETIQKEHLVLSVNPIDISFLKKHHILDAIPENGQRTRWIVPLSQNQINQFGLNNNIISIKPIKRVPTNDDFIFPPNTPYKWNQHYYGPITLPKKGHTMAINSSNSFFFFQIIKTHEKVTNCFLKNNTLFIDNIRVDQFTFSQDYFWVMGDNQNNSTDSRYFGPVPESHILGKVIHTISSNTNKSS